MWSVLELLQSRWKKRQKYEEVVFFFSKSETYVFSFFLWDSITHGDPFWMGGFFFYGAQTSIVFCRKWVVWLCAVVKLALKEFIKLNPFSDVTKFCCNILNLISLAPANKVCFTVCHTCLTLGVDVVISMANNSNKIFYDCSVSNMT